MPRSAPGSTTSQPYLEPLEDRVVPAGDLIGNLVNFGDSLSDTGNFSTATAGALPPVAFGYAPGRFSNGPIWVDTLATALGEAPPTPSLLGGFNYAVNGSTLVVPPPATYAAFGASTLTSQITQYLGGHTPAADDLFTLWAGSNDFFYSFGAEFASAFGNPADPGFDGVFEPTKIIQPATVAALMGPDLDALIQAGGKQFVVPDLGPLGSTPYILSLDVATGGLLGLANLANTWTTGFNTALQGILNARNVNDVHIVEVDTVGILQTLTTINPLGLTNFTNPSGPVDPVTGLLSGPAVNPQVSLYFDSIHPTTQAHQFVGNQAAVDVLNDLDLASVIVTKSSLPDTIRVGSTFTYTITVTNATGLAIDNVKLTDVLPTSLANVTWTSQALGGATGNTAAGAGNLNETLDLPVGSSVFYTVTATLAVPTSLTLTNTATVTGDPNNPGVIPPNTAATETDKVWLHPAFGLNPAPDLYAPHPNADSNQAFIQGLYHQVLGRAGSAGEVASWVQQLNAGLSRDLAVRGFVNSLEHRQQQVESYYQRFLGRTAVGDSGALGWVNTLLVTRDETQVISGILASSEFANAHPGNTAFVTELYRQLLGREPDAIGLAGWLVQLGSGSNRADLVRAFLRSAEGANLATESLYVGTFHRPADAGSAGWSAALQSGSLTYSGLMIGLLTSAENATLAAQNVP